MAFKVQMGSQVVTTAKPAPAAARTTLASLARLLPAPMSTPAPIKKATATAPAAKKPKQRKR
jgi:hypothetical protein